MLELQPLVLLLELAQLLELGQDLFVDLDTLCHDQPLARQRDNMNGWM